MTPNELHILRQINSRYNEIEAAYHDIAQRLGLSDSSCKILYALVEHGNRLPLHDVALTSGLPKQTISSALRKLVCEGLIALSPIDGKAKMVCLTDAGTTLATRTVCRLMDIENEIYRTWSSEELAAYLDLTGRFLQAIRTRVAALQQEEEP